MPKRGLRSALALRTVGVHAWIPFPKCSAEIFIEHLRSYLQQQMRSLLTPHLLLFHEALAHYHNFRMDDSLGTFDYGYSLAKRQTGG